MAESTSDTAIEIDLRTRVFGQTEQVFVLFPGEQHVLYRNIVRRQAVYLDLPTLDLGDATEFGQITQIKERLALSDRVRNWHVNERPASTTPSRELKDYRRASATEKRALLAGAIERLYFDMKPGDLVVVPGPGHWTDVYIGEVVGKHTSIRDEENYPGEEIPARRVRWLAHKPKRTFSEDLIRRLGTPNYFVQLDKSLRDEIFAASFDNYVYDGKFVARFSTTEHSFSTLDEFNIQAFINFVAGVVAATETGGMGAGTKFDLDDALAALIQNPDLIPSLTVNINSPGALRVFKETALPLVLAAFMALAAAGHVDAAPSQIRVVNSLAPAGDVCAVQVDESIKDSFTLMNYDAWKKACYRLQEAKKQTGIDTSVRVREVPAHRRARRPRR